MSKTVNNNFLAGDIDEDSVLFQKLLVDNPENENNEPESKLVAPKPGWCIKTWLKDGNKLFVNICTSELVLKPKDLSEDEVRRIVENDDPTKFRVPMGIGEAHKEHDKEGKDVDVYDIVIHPEFFEKCQQISFFKEFFIMLVFDGLESKYELDLCREYKLLKNRKSIGTLQMQNVRSKSKPFIMEMDDVMYNMEKQASGTNQDDSANIITEVSSKKTLQKWTRTHYVTPVFTILQEPENGYPEFLVLEVELPNQGTAQNMILDVGEDCFILYANDGHYKLDIDLPFDVNNEETGAQFNRKTKKLTVTMPVLPKT